MSNVHAPTPEELKNGPVYILRRVGWTDHSQSFPGFNYSIRFDSHDKAVVLAEHFDRFIGDTAARAQGIQVVGR